MTQSNPNRQRNDDVRRERTSVGVYDDNERVDTTTIPGAGTRTTDPMMERPYNDARTTTEPIAYDSTAPARRSGSAIITWIVIAIVAIIVLWLIFTFLL
jgi:hypothetical protein